MRVPITPGGGVSSGASGARGRHDPVAIRLLVVDEVTFEGGLATLRRNLLPALARRCERLVWAVPDFVAPDCAEIVSQAPNASVAAFLWPRGSWRRVLHGVCRRLPGSNGAGAMRSVLERRLRQSRIRYLATAGGFTHCLSTAVLDQPLPEVMLPTAGVVLDLNPMLDDNCQRNILEWVRQGDKTLTISNFTRQVLLERCPERGNRIYSIPLAAPHVREHVVSDVSPIYSFLYPSVANPHKGHATLFAACLELVRANLDFRLVLTGHGTDVFAGRAPARHPNLEEARRLLEANPDLRAKVSCLGRQAEAGMESEYARCSCVVLPSLYEGFGFPLSEALSHGLPVVCSDIPAFREQLQLYRADDDAALCSPGDHQVLARTMAQMLSRRPPRRSQQNIDRRMAHWTWNDVARRYIECLNE
jgi:glycosyltransferase involved in cell wall biosynthesis